jgi:hypothetical protein
MTARTARSSSTISSGSPIVIVTCRPNSPRNRRCSPIDAFTLPSITSVRREPAHMRSNSFHIAHTPGAAGQEDSAGRSRHHDGGCGQSQQGIAVDGDEPGRKYRKGHGHDRKHGVTAERQDQFQDRVSHLDSQYECGRIERSRASCAGIVYLSAACRSMENIRDSELPPCVRRLCLQLPRPSSPRRLTPAPATTAAHASRWPAAR